MFGAFLRLRCRRSSDETSAPCAPHDVVSFSAGSYSPPAKRPPLQNPLAPSAPRAPSVSTHLLTGELIAQRSVAITVPDVGIRPLEIRWMIENGATVAAGDLLFELDNTETRRRHSRARAQPRDRLRVPQFQPAAAPRRHRQRRAADDLLAVCFLSASRTCGSASVACVDLTARLRRGVREGSLTYPLNHTHWSPQGHAVAAGALAEVVRERG
jgi:hypothetical protein